jgi:hypothetical protein
MIQATTRYPYLQHLHGICVLQSCSGNRAVNMLWLPGIGYIATHQDPFGGMATSDYRNVRSCPIANGQTNP